MEWKETGEWSHIKGSRYLVLGFHHLREGREGVNVLRENEEAAERQS